VYVALGTETTLLELVTALEKATDNRAVVEFRPPRAGEIAQSRADDSVLRALFPDLDAVPLETGLRETVAWFRCRTTSA
jgi:UDP-glucose 4-epimerase